MFLSTGAPPAYMSSVVNSGMSGVSGPQQLQQQPLASQVSPAAGYYSTAAAAAAAAALPPPSVYDAGDTISPVKI